MLDDRNVPESVELPTTENRIEEVPPLSESAAPDYSSRLLELVTSNLRSFRGDTPEDVVAFRGVAVTHLDVLRETGRLPASVEDEHESAGCVCGCLISSECTKEYKDQYELLSRKAAYREAKTYAQSCAFSVAFLDQLGVEHTAENYFEAERIFLFRDKPVEETLSASHFYTEQSQDRENLKDAFAIALRAQGVVLALRSSIFDLEHRVVDAYDFAVKCPDGLPIDFISAIEPGGELEKNYLFAISSAAGR